MLGKVLKYDLKALCRYLVPLYAVIFGLGIMTKLLSFFEKVSIINIILGLMIVALIFAVTFSFVLTGIFNIKHYLDNLFKDEGYLTHTPPVKRGTLLLSKVLASFITIVITFLVVIISLLIAFYQKGLFSDIIDLFNLDLGGLEFYKFMIYMMVYGLIGYLTTVLMVYASIAIGYSKNSNKLVSSVVWALIFYFGIEFLYLGVLGIVMFINPSFIASLEAESFLMIDLLNFFTIFMVFTCLLGLIFYYISYRFMDKKLNLE